MGKHYLLIMTSGYDYFNFNCAKDFDFAIVREDELDDAVFEMEDNTNTPEVIELNEKTIKKLHKMLSAIGNLLRRR